MKRIIPIFIVAILVSCTPQNASKTATQLELLIDQIWQYELSVRPVLATSVGKTEWDDQLADMSAESLKQQNQQYQLYLEQLQQIDSSELNTQAMINYRLINRRIQSYVDDYKFNKHFMPLTAESGFHSSLAFLPGTAKFKTTQDYQNYLSRLEQFPRYFEQQIGWMKKGLKAGITQPKVVLQGFESSIAAFITEDPQQSTFYTPFKALPEFISDKQGLKLKANEIISGSVVPAYQAFYDFMVEQYIPNARDDIAIKSIPNGDAYYRNQSQYYTTLDIKPERIHKTGLNEVARIRAEMESIIKEVEFTGSFADFIHFLRTDERFYAKTPEDLLKEASYIAKKMDAKLPSLFRHMPRTPYGVAPVPEEIAPKYTTGRYVGPRRDDQPGYYWVNTYALERRPLYVLEALTLHEAVPGHHFQNMIARELENVPEFRRRTYLSAFGEGWGLYSEYLGLEAGFYQDPYSRFGRLTYEMWRACRLVVDTGMHLMGWSREQAMEYLASNTALSLHNVKTEIDRYISWPAQALSYKMGELTIKELRAKAERDLGDKFDLRSFHDAILANGAVPLDQLQQQIDDFIAVNK